VQIHLFVDKDESGRKISLLQSVDSPVILHDYTESLAYHGHSAWSNYKGCLSLWKIAYIVELIYMAWYVQAYSIRADRS